MTILDIIKKRQSVRKYLPKPVEEERIHQILEAARLAPSSTNSQPWHFIVVKDRELIKKLTHSVFLNVPMVNKFMEHAPIVIVGCVRPNIIQKITSLFGRYNHLIDVSIAMEHMVLAATELGLGTCWIGWFNENKVKKLLKIPRHSKVIAMLTLGYPDEGGTKATSRKPLEEIYSVDKY